jgi:lactate 2-monooxygenase
MTETAPPANPAAYQHEIYLAGMTGTRPRLPTRLEDLETRAAVRMSETSFGYVCGSAGTESTARANRAAFERWRIVPRALVDVSRRDLATTVLGERLSAPVLLGPVGVLGIVHPAGEPEVARGLAGLGVGMVLSTVSSYPLEDVAQAAGEVPRWFQLYWPAAPEVTASLLERAGAAGYRVLVVTLDTRLLAWRPRDLDLGYLPFLQRAGLANYLADPAFRAGLGKPPEEDPEAAVLHFLGMFGDPSSSWQRLAELRELWPGPIVLKGVLHPDDAERAVDAGMDAVVVSNHGGRQVDGAVASLDALPGVVAAVGGRAEVLFDSGVRSGSDVVKALALGARAVLIGRPYAYGLALDGADGVRHVVRTLLAELDLTLALSGCCRVADLSSEMLVPSPG